MYDADHVRQCLSGQAGVVNNRDSLALNRRSSGKIAGRHNGQTSWAQESRRDQSKLLGAILAFPIGGLIGAIAGHQHVVEQWDRVDH
jgi:hypothetical protein